MKKESSNPLEKATAKQIKAAKLTSENLGNDKPKSQGQILREAGYSEAVAKTPSIVTESEGFKALVETFLPDNMVLKTHKRAMTSMKIEHMVFPLGVSDEEITDLLADVNCTARKFKHSETATHVWYWADDSKSQLKAIELAYKLKGQMTDNNGKGMSGNVFINNAHFNAKDYVTDVEG